MKYQNSPYKRSGNRYLIILFCFLTFFSFQAQEKPNVIVILTDDMGFSDIGSYGGDFVPTPNIDGLAERGLKFDQYYSAAPICSPSRVSLLTGTYPARWNFTTFLHKKKANRAAEQADYLDPAAPSIARIFKENGYVTAHFGKWHMGGGRDVDNAPGFKEYGFDEHVSTYESPDPDPLLTATDWIWSPQDSIKRWDRTKYFVNKTLDFLKRNRGKPVYINLWPDDVHTPWVPRVEAEYTGKFPMNPKEEKAFKLVLEEFDKQMGRLFEGIKELGIEDNTIIIFTSDNGPLPSFRGSRAEGFRGSKLSLYEGGVRMPFIISWPGHIPEGKEDEVSVLNSVDLLPTLTAMASIDLPEDYRGDGENKRKVFLGKPSQREKDMFWEYGRNEYAFNYPPGKDKSPNLAMRSGKWKLLMDYEKGNPELYNLENDPGETNNLAGDHPELLDEMSRKLLEWRNSLPELEPQIRLKN